MEGGWALLLCNHIEKKTYALVAWKFDVSYVHASYIFVGVLSRLVYMYV